MRALPGTLGAAACQTSITPNGERSSTAVAYIIAAVARRPNLKIAVGQTVTKIFFDKTGSKPRAIGIEMAAGKHRPVRYRVRAKREVIVSGGALHSPHILMLSGIGPAAELKKHGIPVVADIDGVGKNLQDHLAVMLIAKVRSSSLQYLAHPVKSLPALIEWLRHGTGAMTSNVAEAFAFVRSKDHGAPAEVTDETSGPKGSDLELLMGAVCYQASWGTSSDRTPANQDGSTGSRPHGTPAWSRLPRDWPHRRPSVFARNGGPA